MSSLPCKNPSCKSYGTPHPNCKCYGGMAEGGEASSFCSEDRKHKKCCEYFAEGGEAAPQDFDSLQEDKPSTAAPSAAPMDFDSLKEDSPQPDLTSFDSLQDDHESPGQQLLTGVEGAARGYAGPLADVGEDALSGLGVPGISRDERKARADVNPTISTLSEAGGLGAGLLTGTGEAGLALEAGEMAGMGSKFLAGAISSGLIQGGDEISKSMLGQGDPNESVAGHLANVGMAGLLGAGGTLLSEGVKSAKIGTKLTSFLGGLAAAANPETEQAAQKLLSSGEISQGAWNAGQKAFNLLNHHLVAVAGAGYGGYEGYKHEGLMGGIAGLLSGSFLGEHAEAKLQKAAPALIKLLSTGGESANLGSWVRDVIDHATSATSGAYKTNKAVDALFKGGAQQLLNSDTKYKLRDKLDSYLGRGGIGADLQDQQVQQNEPLPQSFPTPFAKGGEVKSALQPINKSNGVAEALPDQHVLMSAAKGRISNYLNGLRPMPHPQKLAFDDAPDEHEQKKSYHRALDIANQPLSILHEIGQGTVTGEHLKHFKALYPEIDNVLQRKLTQKITEHQMEGKKPPAHVRDGLSMMMASPLSGEMKPSNIQAAQAVFQAKKMQQQAQNQPAQGGKPAANTKSSLTKISQEMTTSDQSRVIRQQRPS